MGCRFVEIFAIYLIITSLIMCPKMFATLLFDAQSTNTIARIDSF